MLFLLIQVYMVQYVLIIFVHVTVVANNVGLNGILHDKGYDEYEHF